MKYILIIGVASGVADQISGVYSATLDAPLVLPLFNIKQFPLISCECFNKVMTLIIMFFKPSDHTASENFEVNKILFEYFWK